MDKQRLSEAEQSRSFLRVMQPAAFASEIRRRLQIKKPDVHPADPYALADLYEAAEFVLAGTSGTLTFDTSHTPVPGPAHSTIEVKPDPGIAALLGTVAELIKVLVQKTPTDSHNSNNNGNAPKRPRPDGCGYCSDLSHFINDCERVLDDIKAGKCKRNSEGRVVLPSGAFVPCTIMGKDLRSRIEKWHELNPGQLAAAQLLVGVAVNHLSTPEPSSTAPHTMLQHELFALRTRAQVKRALESKEQDEPERTIPPTVHTPPTAAPVAPAPVPTVPAAQPADKAPQHPFSNARDAAYAPPKDRNLGLPPPAPTKAGPAFRTSAPVYNPRDASDVFESCLNAPVTLTQRQIWSIAPEVRAQLREATTPHRAPPKDSKNSGISTTQFFHDIDSPLPFPNDSPVDPDPTVEQNIYHDVLIHSLPTSYTNSVQAGTIPDDLVVSMESSAICSILPIIDNQQQIESIVDGGSQIIAMSEAICHELGLIYDPRIFLRMQSANGSISPSLGLARNVPFRIGDITLYLQVHISIIRNFANEDQTITICDPNSGKLATVPTVPRGPPRHRELALVIIPDPNNYGNYIIHSTSALVLDSLPHLQHTYLTACTNLSFHTNTVKFAHGVAQPAFPTACDSTRTDNFVPLFSISSPALPSPFDYAIPSIPTPSHSNDLLPPLARVFATKKYKPVAQKICPVLGTLPDKFRIERHIIGDPLTDIPPLNPNPPPFTPTDRYTAERRDIIDAAHPGDFLWPKEQRLMHHFMCLQNQAFAWQDSERGCFRTDFFPPIDIPVMPHTPWVQRNIPIPPGIYDQVCKVIRTKIDAGVYEPSNSSYRSRWFCVVKKDGTSLRLVHSLEPLNAVTIQHSGVTPFTDQIAEHFAGRACGAMLDLYTPYGALRLITLPMGWTNSVPIFHDDVTFILQPEIPEFTIPYIDDIPGRGPASTYQSEDGTYETIAENPGIRRFVWEHFNNLNQIVQRMKYCSGTFSGIKSILCAGSITVVGHVCTPAGRIPDEKRVSKIVNWGPCKDLSEVRAFLGTIGVVRIFIQNFAHRAHALTLLTRKDMPFLFGPAQIAAQEDLKNALIHSPALRPIDYSSNAPTILGVDTSPHAVGFLLCQCDPANLSCRYYARFGSITLNEREARFSQPKLELYGLFRALCSWKIYLIGVRNLVVEVDARYIKGMLAHPDLQPGASINRWILAILMFHFTLIHVPGVLHRPDGLSRRPPQPGDKLEPEDDFDDWVDQLHGFMHFINDSPYVCRPQFTISTLAAEIAPDGQDPPPSLSYNNVPRSDATRLADARVDLVRIWHSTLQRPRDMSDKDYKSFVRYCMEFYPSGDQLWRKDPQSRHKLVVPTHHRLFILTSAHDDVGHKGFYATCALLVERFWWPHLADNVTWWIHTCHICQLRQTKKILIPPTVAVPTPIFAKVFMDTMHMPPSGGFKYIVHGRCSLVHYPEFHMLRRETAIEIVTDNGTPFLKAMAYLEQKYHIKHIRISGYNSRANGLIERPHFDVRESIFKAVDGDQSRWHTVTYSVFWAKRVTISRRMGCSPYFAVTGTHPLLPLDISEATYLLPPPESVLSTTELIARRAIALQKRCDQLAQLHSTVFEARLRAAVRFEVEHATTIRDYDFKRGDLVLMRNTAIEKSLSRKMRKRYLGPLIVLSHNLGGAYILCELDGSVFHRPIAAFRIIPYFARTSLPLPPLDDFLDINTD
ncbi:Integrase catalytic domain-containing protein [Mycena sanguinolenta]|uniref:Integrase catalytic domain-containing protein n=1 Tax=Mycena sanguinolenta TaxID=230812 RepID=A0A8H7CWI9_9AGAR|nr:Integrase catalytic domain-containing protein [Mycena sanguinolenta]